MVSCSQVGALAFLCAHGFGGFEAAGAVTAVERSGGPRRHAGGAEAARWGLAAGVNAPDPPEPAGGPAPTVCICGACAGRGRVVEQVGAGTSWPTCASSAGERRLADVQAENHHRRFGSIIVAGRFQRGFGIMGSE